MASAWDDDSGGWWREARREARKLRARFPLSPVSPDALLTWAVQSAGLSVRLRPPTDALLCGAHAVLDHEAETIWLRNNAAPWEKRLFIAHELGHFFLHGGATGDLWQTGCFTDADEFSVLAETLVMVGYGPAQRRETEANVWAREFLLPAPTAQSWFAQEGLTARDIATRAGLPLSIAYAQLAAGLTDDGSLDALETAIEPASPPSDAPPPPLTLDETQAEAARKPTGPTLTHAGPGTGKTRTLTARVLFLVNEQGVRPENILVLTFARKAAGELRERIALYAPNAARRIFISTFHAYGYDLLRRFAHAAGLPVRPLLLEKADLHALMERHLSDCDLQALRYLHDPAYPLGDLLQIINHAKEAGINSADFAVQAAQSGDPKHAEAARVYSCYEAALREHGAMDYSDLVHRAVRLLSENPDVREAERNQWRHVLVDEYQDVNRGGAHLLQALTGDGAGLWAVGDVRQAIYQFRGASPANVARFAHDFPGGVHGDLGINYRSTPGLVSLLGTVVGGGAQTWQAARVDALSPIAAPHALLAVAGDERAQWDGIARKMQEQRENGTRWDEIAVLCRTNQQAREAQAHLANRGVPVSSGDGAATLADAPGGLLAHPDAKNLLALLSRACEPKGSARHQFPDISDAVLEKIGGGTISREREGGNAYDFFADALWGRLGWARHIQHAGVVATLLGLARSFRDRAALITGTAQTENGDTRGAFLGHVRRMALVGSSALQLPSAPRQAAVNDEDTETAMDAGVIDAGVRVMTVHAAKGLEFPVVFVPNLSAGKFPSRAAPARIAPLPTAPEVQTETEPVQNAPENDESTISHEEARLFFVAVSRAQNTLVLTRSEKYNNRRAQASPLLAPLETAQNAGLIVGEVWPEAAGSISLQSTTDTNDTAEVKDDAFPPVTIEAWEMDLYLRCPRRYYFERIAGLAPRETDAPYQAFKRVMDIVLAAPTERGASALFDAEWAATPALSQHAYAPLYRQSAQNLIARFYKPDVQNAPPAPLTPLTPFVVERQDGEIVIRAEQNAPETGTAGRASKTNGVTFRTYRKTPARTAAEPDLRHVLLGEATPNVSVRFLQTGDVLPLAKVTDKARQQQLARADRALKGIRLRVFAPDPTEPKECPACPYFFVCP